MPRNSVCAALTFATKPEHQQAIIRHIVERVTIADGRVVNVKVRPEARPFFDDYPTAVVMAPPDGLKPPSATQSWTTTSTSGRAGLPPRSRDVRVGGWTGARP